MNLSRIHSAMAMDSLATLFHATADRHHPAIDMGRGSSSFDPFAHVDLEIGVHDFASCVPYGNLNGRPKLREIISAEISARTGADVTPDRLIITVGASEAIILALSLMLVEPGEIIVPRYFYPAYPGMIEALGGRCRYVDVKSDFGIDVDRIEAAISPETRGIIINTPFNPFGRIVPAAEIDRIADLSVPVIFDEVYAGLELEEATLAPSGIRHADRHFVVNSFSKSLGIAGFRLGYLVAPSQMMDALINAKAVLSICSSVPSQVLGERLLEKDWSRLEQGHRAFIRGNWQLFEECLAQRGIPLVCRPDAGFFANVELSQYGISSRSLAQVLVEDHGLCTTPADDFSHTADLSEKPADVIRLNFACPTEHILPAIERLASCLDRVSRL